MFRASARALVAPVLAVAVGSAGLVLAPTAEAVPVVAQAEGRFLAGTVGLIDLSTLPDATSALATVPGSPGPVVVPVGAGSPAGLAAGAANQVAGASPSGSSWSAAGAVTDDGSFGGSDAASLGLDLTPYLSQVPVVGSALSELKVTLVGLAATATQAAGADGATTGDYRIQGGSLVLTSPALADLPGTITAAVAPVQAAVDGLAGPTGGLASALYAVPVVSQVIGALTGAPTTVSTVTANLSAVVTPLLVPLTSPDGLVTLDPATGKVTVSLASLVGPSGLNGLPVDTEVLTPAVLQKVSDRLSALVTGLVSRVEAAVDTAVAAAPVSLSSTQGVVSGVLATGMSVVTTGTLSQVLAGTATTSAVLKLLGAPLALPKATLLTALAAPVTSALTTGALPALVTALLDGVLTPLADVVVPGLTGVPSALSLLVNHQESVAGRFTQSAVLATVLPTAPTPAARTSLANASTGRNAGPAVDAPPVVDTITPSAGPTAGGRSVTLTGSGFVPGTTVTIGGVPVTGPAVQVASENALTFTTPAHAAGPVQVSVTTVHGTSNAVGYRYLEPPVLGTVASIAGPAAGGVKVHLLGANFDDGGTSVTIGGVSVAPQDVHVVSPVRLWFRTPRHAAGIVTAAVTTAGGTSGSRLYVFLPKPTVTRLKTPSTPAPGGAPVVVRGSGFRAGATHVLLGTQVVPASVVDVHSSTELSFPAPAHQPGKVQLRVVNPAGMSGYKTFTFTQGSAVRPRLTSVGQTVLSTTGGQVVALRGSGFVPGSTTVRLGNRVVPASLVTVLTSGSLRVVTPALSSGAQKVTVTTRGGTSPARTVTVRAPSLRPAAAPTLSGPSVSPDLAPVLTGLGRPGATVEVYADGSAWCTTTVAADRTWSCVGARPLLRGVHPVAARQSRAGWSASPLTAWTSLTTGPA